MDKLYRIGETAKILGLSSHTLKHYEDKGLIKPVLNEETGYRYYTYRDVGIIITIRNLREMGFSVEEAGQLLTSDPAATQAQLDSQLARNEEAIRDLLHKNQVLKTRRDSLARCIEHIGNWKITRSDEPLLFIPHFNNDIVVPNMEQTTKEQAWERAREDCELAFLFDIVDDASAATNPSSAVGSDDSANDPEDLLTWGIVPYEGLPSSSPLAEDARHIPAGRRLDVFFESNRDTIGANAIEAAKRALAQSGEAVGGVALGILNSYTVTERGIEVLATVTIPLAE